MSHNKCIHLTIKHGISVCMYVCIFVYTFAPHISQEPFIQSSWHLVGVLLGNQWCALLTLARTFYWWLYGTFKKRWWKRPEMLHVANISSISNVTFGKSTLLPDQSKCKVLQSNQHVIRSWYPLTGYGSSTAAQMLDILTLQPNSSSLSWSQQAQTDSLWDKQAREESARDKCHYASVKCESL